MKKRTKNKIKCNFIVFFLVISIITIIIIKLNGYENIKKSEEDDIGQYRKQYLFLEEYQSSYNTENKRNYIISPNNGFIQTLSAISKSKMNFFEHHIMKFVSVFRNDSFLSSSEIKRMVDITHLQSTIYDLSKNFEKQMLESFRVIYDNINSEAKPYTNQTQKYEAINCILKIPSINLEKPVYNKNTTEYLQKLYLVTAYDNMDFNAGGTYIIYGHNSYIENISFQKLPKVRLNDIVMIEYRNTNHEFVVTDIQKVTTEEISNYFIQEEGKIVLVACTSQSTKDNPEYLVVVAKKL